MPALKPGTIRPTPAEDAEIGRQIAADPDDFEMGAAWFAGTRPASAVLPPETYAALTGKNPRGRPKSETVKEPINLRLDKDTLGRWKATGSGWQTRMNEWLAMGGYPVSRYRISPPDDSWIFVYGGSDELARIVSGLDDGYLVMPDIGAMSLDDARGMYERLAKAQRSLGRQSPVRVMSAEELEHTLAFRS